MHRQPNSSRQTFPAQDAKWSTTSSAQSARTPRFWPFGSTLNEMDARGGGSLALPAQIDAQVTHRSSPQLRPHLIRSGQITSPARRCGLAIDRFYRHLTDQTNRPSCKSLRRRKDRSLSALTDEQIHTYHDQGFLIVREAFNRSQIDRFMKHAKADPLLARDVKHNQNYDDDDGIDTRLVNRPRLDDDIYTAFGISERIAGRCAALYDDRMRHFYHLNMQKEPNTGGWQYHQDYGYHYKEFLYPKFVSVMLALDPATKKNGCLRVVPGSNKLGRLEHLQSGSQLITDPERLALVLKEMDEVHCELEPGDAMFFDGNILHASAPNVSDRPRWSMIYAYVPASNPCVLDPLPEPMLDDPIETLDDAAVDAIADRHWASIQQAC
ncbi:MAG: hypothetical protein CME19_04060 [Gemmatimonadetes bacterium]|nr:hypothetical protein [Gemmatimonadota bacterium]